MHRYTIINSIKKNPCDFHDNASYSLKAKKKHPWKFVKVNV